MFSGIIERLARVTLATPMGGSLEIEVENGFPDLSLGESIAVNGVCLTVTRFDAVMERVPLVIPANPHNWRYLATKRDKFGHTFTHQEPENQDA